MAACVHLISGPAHSTFASYRDPNLQNTLDT